MNNQLKESEDKVYQPLDNRLIQEYYSFRSSLHHEYVCYAPFTNLFFNVYGEVYTCCENLTYKYGNYPEQSINELWFGEKARILRDHVKNNDLSLGCTLCKDNLEIKNFNGVKARLYDYTKSSGEYPVRMEFQLANICNLECAMCDGWSSSLILKNRGKLPALINPYHDDFVKQLEEFIPHLQQAFFVGGEPFMIDIYYKIWEKIVETNPFCIISVQTNGTILNNKVIALLEKGTFEINISLDSVRKEKYEKIRRNATFEKTMQNIDYFVDYCKRKNTVFQFTPCPMQLNWKEIPELIGFANSKDVKMLFHTVLYPKRFSLFGFSRFRLKRVNYFLRKEIFKLPGETPNERFNKQSMQTLIYQIAHFYNDNVKKKKWLAYEMELNRYNTRDGLIKFKKEEIRAVVRKKKLIINNVRTIKKLEAKETEKQKNKELLREFKEGKMQLEQSKRICLQKAKYELYYAEDKDYLVRYFRREVNKYCVKRYFYQPVKMVKLKKTIKEKLDEFFALHTEQELAKDVIITVFSKISLPSIIKSLENDTVEQLFNGYLAIKKKENDEKPK